MGSIRPGSRGTEQRAARVPRPLLCGESSHSRETSFFLGTNPVLTSLGRPDYFTYIFLKQTKRDRGFSWHNPGTAFSVCSGAGEAKAKDVGGRSQQLPPTLGRASNRTRFNLFLSQPGGLLPRKRAC